MLSNAWKRPRARVAPGRLGLVLASPGVEPLEDRVLLSTYWWIGSKPNPATGSANTNWSSPANWATNARFGSLPMMGDTVIFSTTDPANPKPVLNTASTVDPAFLGGTVGLLKMDRGYAGVLTLARNLTVADSFAQAGGTVTGGGNLTLHHEVLWSGGTMSGSGTTLIDGTEALGYGRNSQIGAQAVTLDKRQLVIQPTAGVVFGGLTGTANVTLTNGASIVNAGNSVLSSGPAGGLATIAGQGTFWNSGTLQVGLDPGRAIPGQPGQGVVPAPPAPPVIFRLNVPFDDLGRVVVEPNAWLWASGGGSSDGVFTTLASSSGQVGNVLFTGQGATASTWDRATFQGPGAVFLAGNAAVAGRTVAQNFTFVGGQLTLGSMAVGGQLSWLSGTMTGAGIFVVNSGATGRIGFAGVNPALALLGPVLSAALAGLVSGTTPSLSQSAVFSNAGTVALQSAGGGDGLLMSGNAFSRFDNGGTFTIQDSSGIGGGASAVFNNLPGAVFQRANPGLAPSTITAAFDNAGSKAPGGGIIFKTLKQENAAARLQLGGETITGLTPLVIRAGSVLGSGTLAGAVVNGGALLPGGVGLPGLLTVTGSLNEQGGGSIGIDVNGNTPATGYDQISATGFVTLGGTLNVALNGYVPRPTDTFRILALSGGYSCTFSTINLPAVFGPGGSYGFQLVYDPSGVSLVVVSAGPAAPGPMVTGTPDPTFAGLVAWLASPFPAGTYTATINGGSGTPTPGTGRAANASTSRVIDGNTSAAANIYIVSVPVSDSGSSGTTVTTTFTVVAADNSPGDPFAGA